MAKGTCSVPECDRPTKARGWCHAHWKQWRAGREPSGTIKPRRPSRRACLFDGCETFVGDHGARGYCPTHYGRLMRNGDPAKEVRFMPRECSVEGCTRPSGLRSGYCRKHYKRVWRHGDALKVLIVRDGPKVCITPDCDKRAVAKGLCRGHWDQQHRGAVLAPLVKRNLSIQERLLRSRAVDPETGCWNWTGYLAKDGSGRTREAADQPTRVVYRLAYVAWIGPLAKGEVVHHTCANRACFNPEHLQPATQRENMLEMLERKSLRARIAFLEGRVAELEGLLDASSATDTEYTLAAI